MNELFLLFGLSVSMAGHEGLLFIQQARNPTDVVWVELEGTETDGEDGWGQGNALQMQQFWRNLGKGVIIDLHGAAALSNGVSL